MTDVARTLIVGGGLAGLALAIALRRRGLSADIVEREETRAEVGAGLYLIGAATRALAELGLADAVVHGGFVNRSQSIRNHRGALLAEVDVAAYWAETGPCLGVRRAVLHSVLAEHLADAPARLGVTVRTLRQEPDRVNVGFSDGSTAAYELVVGADGIRSSVRRLELGESEPEFRGQVGWRFIGRRPRDTNGWSVYLGTGCAFLLVPIGDESVYCYADIATPRPIDDPLEGRLVRLRERFRHFAAPVREALESVVSADRVHFSSIEEVVHAPYGRGRVVLIGDAAHAMSPNMACGAAMAFEDALVLADIIARRGPSPSSVDEFIRRRSDRISWVRKQTNRRDKLRSLPRMLREPVLRLLTERTYRANYAPLLLPP